VGGDENVVVKRMKVGVMQVAGRRMFECLAHLDLDCYCLLTVNVYKKKKVVIEFSVFFS